MAPKVSIIVPAHNEEGSITKCVGPLMNACKKLDYEIILVDDCSKDSTPQIVDKMAKKYRRVRAVHRNFPNGFGRAIKSGLKASRGKIIIPVMADLSDDPKTIPKLVGAVESGYDIAIGSRFVPGGRLVDYPKFKFIAHRLYSTVVGILFMRNIKDFSNAFKAYNSKVLKGFDINSEGFEITSEMILKPIALHKAKVIEIPTTWRNRKKGKAKFTGLYRQGWRYGKVLLEGLRLKVSN